MVVLALLGMVAFLAGAFLVGHLIIEPVAFWLGNKVFGMAVKGMEYRQVVETQCPDPCCDMCNGTGYSGDTAVPNGMCWDCRGTGHPHALTT